LNAGGAVPRRGLVVLLVGPDGSGKSTLASRVIERARPRFSETLHLHWRPGLLPRAGSLVGVEGGDPTEPHAVDPHGPLLSFALLVYHWIDFFLGSWFKVRPVAARGGLVVMERGWPDLGVDPRRYHLRISPRLVELLGRLLPAPDVVVVLEGDPHELHRRKSELPVTELARQIARWREVRFSARTARVRLDALQEPERLIDVVLQHIDAS